MTKNTLRPSDEFIMGDERMDEAPRGFVGLDVYLAEVRKRERIEEELHYALYLLGDGLDDDARIAAFKARKKMLGWNGSLRIIMRLMRSFPYPVRTVNAGDDRPIKINVHYARRGIAQAGGKPSFIKTVPGIGYVLTKEGFAWLSAFAPEFIPAKFTTTKRGSSHENLPSVTQRGRGALIDRLHQRSGGDAVEPDRAGRRQRY